MTRPALSSIIRFITVGALLLTMTQANAASAAEVSFYLKSGWFTWDEQLNGSPFVKEKGLLYGAGVTRRDELAGWSVTELAEVWGGSLDYDGHDVTGTSSIKSQTAYLGTKEEAAAGYKLPVATRISLEPFAAVGHRFWIRTRSGEDWNSFYGKAGVTGEVRTDWGSVYLKGGALLPIYTRNHVSLTNAGYSDVVTEPKNLVSAFAEAGVTRGHLGLSIEYEGLRFGESSKVATSKLGNLPGAVIQNNQAYQPDSHSHLVSLKLAYTY
jgi:hypothetical protein